MSPGKVIKIVKISKICLQQILILIKWDGGDVLFDEVGAGGSLPSFFWFKSSNVLALPLIRELFFREGLWFHGGGEEEKKNK